MITIISFVVALMTLVFIHEGGHFLAARWCGVKVKKFSIGFGKPIFSWLDKSGTEWAIGWIPLGGYVSMLDEKEVGIENKDLALAFNKQSILKRMTIITAGPIANFIAAWFILSTMLAVPHQTWTPVLGETYPTSIAYKAGFRGGDTVLVVNGKAVSVMEDWQDSLVQWAISAKDDLVVKVLTSDGKLKEHTLLAPSAPIPPQDGWLKALGWSHIGVLPGIVILEKVEPLGSFGKAGLRKGDIITKIDDTPVNNWGDMLIKIGQNPLKSVNVVAYRGSETITKLVVIEKVTIAGVDLGKVGVSTPVPEVDSKLQHLNFIDAASAGAKKTWMLITLTVDGIRQLLTGSGSSDQVSGPMGIAEQAGKSAESGASQFFSFLAILSVSLGVLNLLPIPVLDGGHLIMLVVEKIKGSPISFKVERLALTVGLFLIGSLTIIGFLNDARKMFGG